MNDEEFEQAREAIRAHTPEVAFDNGPWVKCPICPDAQWVKGETGSCYTWDTLAPRFGLIPVRE